MRAYVDIRAQTPLHPSILMVLFREAKTKELKIMSEYYLAAGLKLAPKRLPYFDKKQFFTLSSLAAAYVLKIASERGRRVQMVADAVFFTKGTTEGGQSQIHVVEVDSMDEIVDMCQTAYDKINANDDSYSNTELPKA